MSMIPYLYDFERPFHPMEREFFKPNEFFEYSPFNQLAELGSGDIFEPRMFNPWEMFRHCENVMKPMEQLSATMNQMALHGSKITADNQKFQVSIDVQHFLPDEISVKVIDRNVIVEGKHEEKRDDHGYVSRQFVRRYALPQGCLPDTVLSKLSSDGVLTVIAPKILPLPSVGEKIVPITHTGPIQKKICTPDSASVDVK